MSTAGKQPEEMKCFVSSDFFRDGKSEEKYTTRRLESKLADLAEHVLLV